jgi:hypothetical protein
VLRHWWRQGQTRGANHWKECLRRQQRITSHHNLLYLQHLLRAINLHWTCNCGHAWRLQRLKQDLAAVVKASSPVAWTAMPAYWMRLTQTTIVAACAAAAVVAVFAAAAVVAKRFATGLNCLACLPVSVIGTLQVLRQGLCGTHKC